MEDALHATRAAVEEGIVPGGGIALLRAVKALDGLTTTAEEKVGVEIVRRAVEEPLRQLVYNGGGEGSVVVEKVKGMKPTEGYDVQGEAYGDMFKLGIIDPTKVTRSALQNAASVAGLLLTTEALIADVPEKKEKSAGGGGGGGGYGGEDMY